MRTAPSQQIQRARAAVASGRRVEEAVAAALDPTSSQRDREALQAHVRADIHGGGPLIEALVTMPGVTDVLLSEAGTWIDRGAGLERLPQWECTEVQRRSLAVRMAASCDRRLDDSSPIVDATLANGVRLHAVLPPLSADGTVISLRTRPAQALSLAELVERRTLSDSAARYLHALITAHASCLLSGATGSGKTTLLAGLLSEVDARERIVCVEEASELFPRHPHVIHLQERNANVQGVGAVRMTDLVRAALRMRPDRLVVGECRGVEVKDMLSALNTGHDGGWATIHANSPHDVPARLGALGALAGMSDSAVARQAASAIDAVIHLHKRPHRHVAAIAVVHRQGEELKCVPAVHWDAQGRETRAEGWSALVRIMEGKDAS